jgi:hypothetical protein
VEGKVKISVIYPPSVDQLEIDFLGGHIPKILVKNRHKTSIQILDNAHNIL